MMALGVPAAAAAAVLIPALCLLDACSAAMQRYGTLRYGTLRYGTLRYDTIGSSLLLVASCLLGPCSSSLFEALFLFYNFC